MDATPASPLQTIALVDDDRNILTSVSIAMQAEGYITRLYPDGETALKALLENPADLGIFDIKMPKERCAMPIHLITQPPQLLD